MWHLQIEDCEVEYTFNVCMKGYFRNYFKKKITSCNIGPEGMTLPPNFLQSDDKVFLCPETIFLNSFPLLWLSNTVRLANLLAQLLLKDIFCCKTSDPREHWDEELYDPF